MRILCKIYIYLSIPLLWTLRLLELLSATLLKALSLPHMDPEHASIFWPPSRNHPRPYYDDITPVLDSSPGKFNIFAAFAAVVAALFIFLSRKYTATLTSNQLHIAQYKNLRQSGQRAALQFSLKIAELNNVVRTQISQIHQVRAHIFTMQEDLAVQKRANEGHRLQEDKLRLYLLDLQHRLRMSKRAAKEDSDKRVARQRELLQEVNAGKARIAELEKVLRLKGGLVEERTQDMASMKRHLHKTQRDLNNARQDIAKRDEYIESLEEELATKTRTTFRERIDDRVEMGDLRREIETLNRDLKDARQLSETFQQERDALQTQLDDAEAKFAALKIEQTEMGEKLNHLVEMQDIQDDALRQENAQLVKDIKVFHQQVNLTLLAQAERSLSFVTTIEQPAQPTVFQQDLTLRDDEELREMLQALQDDLARTSTPRKRGEASADSVIAEEANGEQEHGSGNSGELSSAGSSWASDVELAELNGSMDAVDEDDVTVDPGSAQEMLPSSTTTNVPTPVTTPSLAATQVVVVAQPTQDVGIPADEQVLSPETVKEKSMPFRDAAVQHASSEEQNRIPRGRGRNIRGAQLRNKTTTGAQAVVGNHALSTNRGARVINRCSSQSNWRQSMGPRAG